MSNGIQNVSKSKKKIECQAAPSAITPPTDTLFSPKETMADFLALLLNRFNQDKKWCVFFHTEDEDDCPILFGSTAEEVLLAVIYRLRKNSKYKAKNIHVSKVYLKDGVPSLNEIPYEELVAAGLFPPKPEDMD